MDTNAGHGRYGYSALPDRPVYDWPEGKRLAVYIGLNLETFAFGEGLEGLRIREWLRDAGHSRDSSSS